ncbi:hypothetical protein Ancab_038955 [Ancistrocladus abbreviatus]
MERRSTATTTIANKWTAAVASIWIQSTSGSLYTFGIYSSAIKSTQSYSQTTLDTLSFFKDLGGNVGILAGLLYSFAGPRVVLLVGAIQCFVGYFLMWLSVIGFIDWPPVAVMCLFMVLAAHAVIFFNTADVVTSVHNFRDFRGTAVGIMKGFLGLSGAILIQIYRTIFKGNPAAYLLMLALLPSITPLVLMWFVSIDSTYTGNERHHLNSFSLIAMIIASYLMIIVILENILTWQLPARVVTLAILLLLLASPLYIVFRAQWTDLNEGTTDPPRDREANRLDDIGREGPVRYSQLPSNTDLKEDSGVQASPLEQNLNLLQALCTINFWLLFFSTACAMGSGLTTVNNMSQIGESLGYRASEISTLVSLWSIWNFLGRFGAGYISDYILHIKGWARPVFIAVTLPIMSLGHSVIASGMPGALYTGSVLVGVCYGSQWSLMPTITSEIFGVADMGTIFNMITIAGPIGSYILSVRVVGYIYDREATGEGNTCTGVHCFMLSFIIMASVTLIGSVVAIVLFFRTKDFYKQVVFRRLKHAVRQ